MIELEGVSKLFDGRPVLRPTSFAPGLNRTTVLLGPSGCGKSTLLRLMIGLLAPDSGRVSFEGMPVSQRNIDKARHRVGYVIQEGGLFPHLTARRNVTLLARHLGRDPAWIEHRVAELGTLAHLPADAMDRFPAQLSGGERQRVALMRALMLDPELLLLDEPLAALDAITRRELQSELKEIFGSLRKTVVLVTHDLHEAAWFGDEILLMREGRVVQRGTLDDMLERPSEPFVAEFVRAQRADARLVTR